MKNVSGVRALRYHLIREPREALGVQRQSGAATPLSKFELIASLFEGFEARFAVAFEVDLDPLARIGPLESFLKLFDIGDRFLVDGCDDIAAAQVLDRSGQPAVDLDNDHTLRSRHA